MKNISKVIAMVFKVELLRTTVGFFLISRLVYAWQCLYGRENYLTLDYQQPMFRLHQYIHKNPPYYLFFHLDDIFHQYSN